MVYKRYIKEGGKVFGPYYYESYRENGKVKTRFISGPKKRASRIKKDNAKKIMIGLISIVLLLILIAIFNYPAIEKLTGKAVEIINPETGEVSEQVSESPPRTAQEDAESEPITENIEVLEVPETSEEAQEDIPANQEPLLPYEETPAEELINEENGTISEPTTEVTPSETNLTFPEEDAENITEINITEYEEIISNETTYQNVTSDGNLSLPLLETNASVLLINESLLNNSLLNETSIINETLPEFNVTETENQTKIITLKQYKAVINLPVKWIKVAKIENNTNFIIKLPKEAENISIKTNEEVEQALQEAEKYAGIIENAKKEEIVQGKITGYVSLDTENREGLLTRFFKWLLNFRITGKVIQEDEIQNEITETKTDKVIDLNDILGIEKNTEIAVEYYTRAPTSSEENLSNGKRIVISAPDELNYTDILAYTEIRNQVPLSQKNKIKLYWIAEKTENETITPEIIEQNPIEIADNETETNNSLENIENTSEVTTPEIIENNSEVFEINNETPSENYSLITGQIILDESNTTETTNETEIINETIIAPDTTIETTTETIGQEVYFDAYDLDENGYIDYIEWNVPHLSNQTYELIIEISAAEHLDSNRNFLSDIYEQVKEKDGVWSEAIGNNEYVRLTFEQNLTSGNDITIYARALENVTSSIEVYEKDENEIIARFENISGESWNKVYLTALPEGHSQDVFDLRIVSSVSNDTEASGIVFDYFVDPQANDSGNIVYQCGTLDVPGTYTMNQSITNDTLATSCINITIQNITLDCNGSYISSDDNYAGIYSNQFNTTIKNCNVSMGNEYGGYGVYLEGGGNSYILNNTFKEQYYGIHLYFANSTRIENNLVNNNTVAGILIDSSSNNNLTSNTVLNSGANGKGISIYSASNNNLLVNNTLNNNPTGIGITWAAGGGSPEYNLIINNSIWNCTSEFINIFRASYNLFDGNSMNQSSLWGIFNDINIIGGSMSHNIFKNTNMTNIDRTGVVFGGNTVSQDLNNTFINFTYNNESVGSGSQIVRKWYYRAYVNDTAGNYVPGANITAYNRTNKYQFNLTTNATGWTDIGEIIDYVNTGGTKFYYSYYTIYASNLSKGVASYLYNVSAYESNLEHVLTIGTISACSNIYGSNTIYTLQNSVTSTRTCINITADNVTLNCGNWSNKIIYGNISSSTIYAGIYSNKINTTIINCEVRKGTAAATTNYRYGIYLVGSNNSRVENINASNNLIGVYLIYSSNNTLINITANANTDGVYFNGANNNYLYNITSMSNSETGIYLDVSLNNLLVNITSNSNTERGVYLILSSNNTLLNITANANREYGVYFVSSSNNTIGNIIANSNRIDGALLSGSSENNLLNNITADSNMYGIGIFSSLNNALIHISASNNSEYGIYIYSSQNNTLRNTNCSNNSLNFYIDGTENSHFNHNIDLSNIVDYDKKIYYNYSISNHVYNYTDTGMVVCANCNNITVKDLNLSHKNYAGVYLFNTTNSTIKNVASNLNDYGTYNYLGGWNTLNNITADSISDGVILSYTSNNILTNITTVSNSNGVSVGQSANNTFRDIMVSDYYGFYLIESSYNTLINITANVNGKYGMVFEDSSNNNLTKISSWNCTSVCLLFDSSSNNSISDGFVNLSYHLIYLKSASDNNKFTNFLLTNSENNDTYLESSSINNTFLNVTYNSSKEYVEAGSQLIRTWYYRAYVNDTAGNYVPGANITAYNRTNKYQFNLTTNATGWTDIGEIIDYVNTGSLSGINRTYYSNYTIYARNSSYPSLFHKYNTTAIQNNLEDNFELINPANVTKCGLIDLPGITYTLTQNMSSTGTCINITAANITINCANFSNKIIYGDVSSTTAFYGIISNKRNTTIKNCEISRGSLASGTDDRYGVYLSFSNNSRIENVNASRNYYGVYLINSYNCTLNNITANDNNVYGIILVGSSNNNLNNITANNNSQEGIDLSSSNNNILTNIITNLNDNVGIFLSFSSNNTINNTIANLNSNGVSVWSSSNNQLGNITANSNILRGVHIYADSNNSLIDITANSNWYGVYFDTTSNNTLRNVNMSNNSRNFYIIGTENSHFNHNIDLSNTIDYNKRLYYNYSISNRVYDSSLTDAGMVVCANCNNITVKDLNLSHKNYAGVYLFNTTNSTFENIISNLNYYGIFANLCPNSILKNITANSNDYIGLEMDHSTNNNLTNINLNSNWYGVYFDESSNAIVNNLTVNLNTRSGMVLWDSSNNTFANYNIWSCLTDYYPCLDISNSDSNIFSNGIINSSVSELIYIHAGSDNNRIINLQLVNATKNETYIYGPSVNNTFLNVTYNSSKEYVEEGSQLIREWYYQANITLNNNSVSGIMLSAYNRTGNPDGWMFNLTTNSNGYTNITEIVDYINNGTRNYLSNYTINTSIRNSFEGHELNVSWLALQSGFTGLILDEIGLSEEEITSTDTRIGSGGGAACISDWNCSGWSKCIGGQQTRTCADKNKCAGASGKPEEKKECSREETPEAETETPAAAEGAGAGCSPNWKCGNWSECEVTYRFADLINGKVFLQGEMKRECEDAENCYYNKREIKKCETKILINAQKVRKCFKEYIEIRDEKFVLISRLEAPYESTKILNIQMLIDSEYCPYCYDNEKNYDEDEVDCVYHGNSCPLCREKVLEETYPIASILLIIFLLLLTLAVLWHLTNSKRARKIIAESLDKTKK